MVYHWQLPTCITKHTIQWGFFSLLILGFIVKMHLLKVDREKLIERRVVSGVEWMARLQRCAYCCPGHSHRRNAEPHPSYQALSYFQRVPLFFFLLKSDNGTREVSFRLQFLWLADFQRSQSGWVKVLPPSLAYAAVLPDVSGQQAPETDKSICNR